MIYHVWVTAFTITKMGRLQQYEGQISKISMEPFFTPITEFIELLYKCLHIGALGVMTMITHLHEYY